MLGSERGAVGGIEVLPFAVLVFVTGSLLIANAWGVVDAKVAVDQAAREAGRAYVESVGPTQARTDARTAAEAAIRGTGRDPARLRLEDNRPPFVRCAIVEHRASYDVPTVRLPFVGSFGPRFTVHSVHREVLDPFRSGLDGEADCA